MREDRLRAVCAEVLETDGFDEAAFTAQVEYISVLADGVLEFHLADGRAVQHSIDLRRSGTKWSEEQRRHFHESTKGLYTPERRQAMSEHMKQLRKERGANWRKE